MSAEETEVQNPDPAPEAPPSEATRLPLVNGAPLEKLPEDLYIPPDALQVFLETFEGPLDLLLYLIRRQNLNILDIPVLKITEQYLQYMALMRELRLDLAAEYLLMAALLAEIKSRILLPRPPPEEEDPGDPRMELVRRLQEYERFKTAAEHLDEMPRMGRDWHRASARPEAVPTSAPLPTPSLRELMLAFRQALLRAEMFSRHQVAREPLSTRERMSSIMDRLRAGPADFTRLCDPSEGRAGVTVCFIAVLELTKLSMIEISQARPFAELALQLASASGANPQTEETAS
ncbi:MAG: segregation and condensation protein A [Panacagrimonas sp.]